MGVQYFNGPVVNSRNLQIRVWVPPGAPSSQSIANNTTTLYAELWLISRNSYTAYSGRTRIKIGIGNTFVVNKVVNGSYGYGDHFLGSGRRTVSHNSAGALSIGVSGTWADEVPPSAWSLVYSTGSIPMPTIPRATTPSLSGGGGFTTGAAKTISLPRASSGFTHDVSYKFGTATGTIATGAGVSTTWTPPHSLLSQIPNSESGTVTITVVTKQGSSTIGTKSANYVLSAGAGTEPDVPSVAWTDGNVIVATSIGAYVQGQSILTGVVSSAGQYGASITERTLTVSGVPVQPNWTPNSAGTLPVVATVKDSRGKTRSWTGTISVLEYAGIRVTKALVRRATDVSGTLGDGAFLRIDLSAAVPSLIVGGTQKNELKLRVQTSLTGESPWTTRNDLTHTELSYSNALIMVGGGDIYPVTQSLFVRVLVSDNASQQPATILLPVGTTEVPFDIGEEGTGHGKLWERGAIDAGGPIYQEGVQVANVGHTHTGDQVSAASTTARGTAKIATQSEVDAGEDTLSYVTPATLKNAEHLPFAMAAGSVTAGVSWATVTLPAGRFTVAPLVTAQMISGAGADLGAAAMVTSVSASSFILRKGGAGSEVRHEWIAVQMTEGSAAG